MTQVLYTDSRGAGCVRVFSDDAALALFVSKLRREARIVRDGRDVGAVERNDGRHGDKRVKWLWYFEKQNERKP